MKNLKLFLILTMLLMTMVLYSFENTRVMEVDLQNNNRVIPVIETQAGAGTLIEFPDGLEVIEAWGADKDNFNAQKSGNTVVITALTNGVETHVFLRMNNGKIYSLYLKSQNSGKPPVGWVWFNVSPFKKNSKKNQWDFSPKQSLLPKIQKNSVHIKKSTAEIVAKERNRVLQSLDTNFSIHGRSRFNIDLVVDDGKFTYVKLSSKVVPACFFNDGRSDKKEVVRFGYDQEGLLTIQKKLDRGQMFILQVGNRISKIIKK